MFIIFPTPLCSTLNSLNVWFTLHVKPVLTHFNLQIQSRPRRCCTEEAGDAALSCDSTLQHQLMQVQQIDTGSRTNTQIILFEEKLYSHYKKTPKRADTRSSMTQCARCNVYSYLKCLNSNTLSLLSGATITKTRPICC